MSARHHATSLLTLVYIQSFALVLFGIRELYRVDLQSNRSIQLPVITRALSLQTNNGPAANSLTRRRSGVVACPGEGDQTDSELKVPSFVIAGAQKSGTTALFYLMKAHPDIESSLRFETHFFDRQKTSLPANDAFSLNEKSICDLRREYQKEFSTELAADVLTFEKVCCSSLVVTRDTKHQSYISRSHPFCFNQNGFVTGGFVLR